MSQPDHVPPSVPPAGEERPGRPEPGWPGPGWPTTPPSHRPLGPVDPTEAGPYRLEALLGAGGMGRVYLGRTPAGSAVAVKVVHREYAGDRAFRTRFEHEVAAARRVQGLYTVPVVDADLRADEPWLATAYVPGPSLQDAVAEYGPLPVDAAVGLIARVAEALQSIHAADVIHRDLKPSNIILTAEGPKVIDFGIARAADVTSVTGTGMLTGTPAYMAPEYIRGQTVTEAVDVFALGVVACFAVAGRPAFGAGSHHSMTYRILEQAPDLDDCPEPVRTVAARCLEKDPRRRPTPAEVIQLCRSPVTTGNADGPGHTVLSPPRTRTVVSPAPVSPTPGNTAAVSPAPGLHDAETTPASPATRREHGEGVAPGDTAPVGSDAQQPYPPSPDLLATPVPSLPALLGGVGVLALVVMLVVVFLPGHSDDSDTPSVIESTATVADFRGSGSDVAVAFSPDGKITAAGGGGRVELRDAADRTLRATLSQRDKSGKPVLGIPSLAFSPDGKSLAVGTDRGVVGLWNVAERRQVGLGHADRARTIDSVAFSPDGKLLAAGGGDGIRLWDADSGKERMEEVAVLDGEASIDHVAFSPDGRTLASAGYNSFPPVPSESYSVRLWDVAGRTVRDTLHNSKKIWGMAFSPDGKTLATTDEEYMVTLVNVARGREEDALVDEADTQLRTVAFSPDGRTLAVVMGPEVRLWDMADREQRAVLIGNQENVDNVKDVVFRPDGKFLATMTYGGTARLWKMP
ncbi:WD40 repeat domain-containing serine/threonine protein kinase [Streptomyces sp. NRRL F-5135]|uniref:WD40 repeat domain-containing serine/threonine protein kinase n=1 Tax=Streptomyces sp. NRRL F-5135 TaxID=1463858 RepID=UPI0004C57717|nr:serine/threonine-protein kinase [Streptomyces sp. NRRL F-5135]